MSPIRAVLVVEDEPAIANLVALHLEQCGFEAVIASDGRRALDLLGKALPSLVVLDLMLPDMDGLDVLRRLRSDERSARLPVVLLTARGSEEDRVTGLELGADDYVTKPFSPRELMLRVTKLLAVREPVPQDKMPTVFGCLEIDEDRFRVAVEGRTVEISATEMRLLTELIRARGKVLSRTQILQSAWGFMPNVTERTVDTHIKRLRQKLGAAAAYIETVRGVGYRWVEDPSAASTRKAVTV
ncbi:MAG: response regulator transcription factor [Candidatus Sumerlaeaceae bacterium]|nr:response regulator transcription factor [Candidatus Sumerlaeaceae bacterium]